MLKRIFWGEEGGERRVCLAVPEPYFFLPSKNRLCSIPCRPLSWCWEEQLSLAHCSWKSLTQQASRNSIFCSSLLQWKRWADLDPACSLARINPLCTKTGYKLCPFRKGPCVWNPSEMQCHTISKCIPDVALCWDPFYCLGFFCFGPSELKQSSCSARLYQCPLCSVREVPLQSRGLSHRLPQNCPS